MDVTDPVGLLEKIQNSARFLGILTRSELLEMRQADGHDELQLHLPFEPEQPTNVPVVWRHGLKYHTVDVKQVKSRSTLLARSVEALHTFQTENPKDKPYLGDGENRIELADIVSLDFITALTHAGRSDARLARMPVMFASLRKIAKTLGYDDLENILRIDEAYAHYLQVDHDSLHPNTQRQLARQGVERPSPQDLLELLDSVDKSRLDVDQRDHRVGLMKRFLAARDAGGWDQYLAAQNAERSSGC